MSSTTDRFSIPKPTGGDPVADGDNIMRLMADRIDYMLGESGDSNIVPSAANTKTTKTIAFGRTYKTPPRVLVSLGRDAYVSNITNGVVVMWVDDVTTTDFTVAVNAANTTTREFTWNARPNRTDVTP